MIQLDDILDRKVIFTSEKTIVFRGVHPKTKEKVVVKTTRGDYFNEKELFALEKEYEILNALAGNQVPTALSFVKSSSGAAIIFDDQDLVSLDTYRKSNGFERDSFFAIAKNTLEALKHIHLKKIVHKDINPSNILINEKSHKIWIADFGLSSSFSRVNGSGTGALVGTLAYMSPEQTGRTNRGVDHRSDIYSLGITFYYLLTGSLPYQDKDPIALIYSHLTKKLPDMRLEMPGSDILSQIIQTMVQKSPEDRYQSCAGVLHDLLVWEEQSKKEAAYKFVPRKKDPPIVLKPSSKIYGRSLEFASFSKAVDMAQANENTLLVLNGKEGSGKTALRTVLQEGIEGPGGWYFYYSFKAEKDRRPFGAFLHLVENVLIQLNRLPKDRMERFKEELITDLGPALGELIEQVPILGSFFEGYEIHRNESMVNSKAKIRYALSKFYQKTFSLDPCVGLFIDDWQWGDADSAQIFEDIIVCPTVSGSVFVATLGDGGEGDARKASEKAIEHIEQDNVHVSHMRLDPLPFEQVKEFVQDTLGQQGQQVHTLAEYLVKFTGGTPYLLHETMVTLAEKDILTFDSQDQYWVSDTDRLTEVTVPNSMLDVFITRFEQLSNEAATLVKVASCFDEKLDLMNLAKATASEVGTCLNLVGEAEQQGLFIRTKDELRFVHDDVQKFVYQSQGEENRSQSHINIANRIREDRSLLELAPEDMKLVVSQLNLGWPDSKSEVSLVEYAEANIRLGSEALDMLLLEKATFFLSMALRVLETAGEDQTQLQELTFLAKLKMGEAFLKIGRLEQSGGCFEGAITLAKTKDQNLDSNIKLMELRLLQIKYDETIKLARTCFELLGWPFPAKLNPVALLTYLIRIHYKMKKVDEKNITSIAKTLPENYAKTKKVIRIVCEVGTAAAIKELIFSGL